MTVSRGWCLALILLCAWLARPGGAALAGSGKITLYFYTSETNINNFKSLKMEFDGYLSRFGDYEFQPFSSRETFESQIRGKVNCLLFMSSWHFGKIYREYNLKPLLVGVREGSKYQRRVLVAGADYADLGSVRSGTVASSANVAFTRGILREIFNDAPAAEAVRILTVPKDIDALMSVGFQMARSALITENALENLGRIDPVLHSRLKVVGYGGQSLLPVVAAPSGFAGQAGRVVSFIRQMAGDPDGTDVIKMIDLDGWEPVGPSEIAKLEG